MDGPRRLPAWAGVVISLLLASGCAPADPPSKQEVLERLSGVMLDPEATCEELKRRFGVEYLPTAETPADQAPERVRQKVAWVREGAEAAGRDPDAIELNSLSFVVAITDDPKGLREALARNSGMTPDQVADCPLFLTGPGSEIRDRLEKRREDCGISYVVIQGRDPEVLENFAEQVVEPLSGH